MRGFLSGPEGRAGQWATQRATRHGLHSGARRPAPVLTTGGTDGIIYKLVAERTRSGLAFSRAQPARWPRECGHRAQIAGYRRRGPGVCSCASTGRARRRGCARGRVDLVSLIDLYFIEGSALFDLERVSRVVDVLCMVETPPSALAGCRPQGASPACRRRPGRASISGVMRSGRRRPLRVGS